MTTRPPPVRTKSSVPAIAPAEPHGLSEIDLDFVRQFVRSKVGLVLDDGKRYLVESRLAPVVRRNRTSLGRFLAGVRAGDRRLERELIESLVTHETFFFRDEAPFEALRSTILPRVMPRGGEVNIWSAACSTGQEAYSIAMLARELVGPSAASRVKILATDISSAALERARAGVYNTVEVNRGLTPSALQRHFEAKEGGRWQLNADLRRTVEFREMNLAVAPWPQIPTMDVIFLRNVLIYFDDSTKKKILDQIGRVLRPGGVLFLGATESTLQLETKYQRVVLGGCPCYEWKAAPPTTSPPRRS